MRSTVPVEKLSSDTKALYEVLNNESDMACVVIGAAYIDSAIKTLLETNLKKSRITNKLLDPRGAIGTYSASADLAYCLGLIGKTNYSDICEIANIRNHFAHSHLKLTFEDAEIQDFCSKLKTCRQIPLLSEKNKAPENYTEDQLRMVARDQFNVSVALIVSRLVVDALSAKIQNAQQPHSFNAKS